MSSSRSRIRSDSASSAGSRNDLFSASWAPAAPPPKPFNLQPQTDEQGQSASTPVKQTVGIGSGNWSTSMAESRSQSVTPSPIKRSRAASRLAESPTETGSSRTMSPTRSPLSRESDEPSPKTSSFFSTSHGIEPPPSERLRQTRLGALENLTIKPPGNISSSAHQDAGALAVPSHTIHSPISPILVSPITPPPIPSSSSTTLDVDLETADDMGVVGTGRYARVLRAQYRILKESEDDGSMGQTSEWFPCAVKVPLTDDPLAKQMVETEARILAHLQKTDEVPSPQFAPEERSQSLLPRGRDRIVKYIGLKELGGFLRRDVKSPAVSRQGSVRRKPRRDSRGHTRSVSDSTALKALAEQGNEESQHDRSERVAAFANSVTVDEGIGVGGTLPCLILEYLPRSLSAWLGDPSHTQLMGRERWRLWAMELCEAVAWCHSKGILHGDIKPANVLVDDSDHLRLVDFGSSLMLSSTADAAAPPTIRDLHDILALHDAQAKSPSSTSLDLGTAPYSAPELFADNVVVSYPSDVFSLGVTLWEMLTLRAPYAGKRTVETMLGVRRGMFWQIHERDRIGRIGDGDMTSMDTDPDAFAGVRRAGSLRIPGRERRSIRSPLVSDVQRFNSRSSGELAQLPITVERQLIKMADTADRVSPDQPVALHYSDGSPAMLYPNGHEHVEERLRDLIRRSVDPDLSRRPVAMEVVQELYTMY